MPHPTKGNGRRFAEGNVLRENEVISRIVECVENDAFDVYGQGIYDRNWTLVETEILTRLSVGNETVSPLLFLDVVRKYGLAGDFDRSVIRSAVGIMAWNGNSAPYSINVHKSTLSDSGFVDFVRSVMEDFPGEKPRVVFEILETQEFGTPGASAFMDEGRASLRANVAELSKIGTTMGIDDFPMGDNGIKEVSVIGIENIRFIKFDGSWLLSTLSSCKRAYIQHEDKFRSLISDIVENIRRMNSWVDIVAERVEDENLFRLYSSIPGIDYFQGYFFEKPRKLAHGTGEDGFQPVRGEDGRVG